jgi:hypothetical protein
VSEGEGGEGFYIAQSGKCPDLLVTWGGGPKMATLLAQARSASVQASSPSAQIKAGVPQVGNRNWTWEKKNLMFDCGVIM